MAKLSHAMEPEKLKVYGNKTLEALERGLGQLASGPVRPHLKPGELAKLFPSDPPLQGRGKEFDKILEDVEEKILPGMTNWQHPNFLAFFPSATSIPAVLGELAMAATNQVGLQWQSNPIGTELEVIVMDWLTTMLHAPPDSPFRHTSGKGGGIIQNTAGETMAVAMIAARVCMQQKLLRKRLGLAADTKLTEEQREETFYADSSKLVVYQADQCHFSTVKAIRCAGMRCHKIRAEILPETGNYAITKAQVVAAMEEDRAKGLIPAGVILCHGYTNTAGSDLIAEFHNFFDEYDLWVHIDAAYAGTSLILEDMKECSLALQNACTSFNINGSKTFLCGFDSVFFFVRDRKLLMDVFSLTGSYLDNDKTHDTIYSPEFKDWAIPLGRRFRALRIWMVIEYFGVEGLREYLQDGRDQADWLRAQIEKSDFLSQPVRTDLKLVCLEAKDKGQTKKLVDEMKKLTNDGEKFLILPSVFEARPIIRVAFGGANTTMDHAHKVWDLLVEASKNVGLV